MGLHQPYGLRREAGLCIGLLQCLYLSFRSGSINTFKSSVTGSTDPFYHGIYSVLVAFGILQAFECYHSNAFSDQHSLGIDVKRSDGIVRRKGRGFTERQVHKGGVVRVDPAGDHDFAAVFQQIADGHFHCGQRTGTGGIQYAVGSAQIQPVCHPACNHIAEHSGK